jgi:hypothetical protein
MKEGVQNLVVVLVAKLGPVTLLANITFRIRSIPTALGF